MQVLIIRHAYAGDRETFARTGAPDSERPVTPKGKKQMRRGARGLRRLVPAIDRLATSPYRRAAQTARIVARAYNNIEPAVLDQLVPEADPSAVARWLRAQRVRGTIALVGHDPQLSRVVSHLITGAAAPVLSLEKGGACAIDLPVATRAGTLEWLLTGKQLRSLGKRRRKSIE